MTILIAIAIGVALYKMFMSAAQISIVTMKAIGVGSSTLLVNAKILGSNTMTLYDIRLYDEEGDLLWSFKDKGDVKCLIERIEINGVAMKSPEKAFTRGIRLKGGDVLLVEVHCEKNVVTKVNTVVLVTDKGPYEVTLT